MGLLAALRALTWQVKLGIAIGILAILAAVIGSTAYVSYNKGLNESKVEMQRYVASSQRLLASIQKIQSKVDVRIVTEYKDRVAYVDRVVYRNKTVIETSVPEQYKLSRGWIYGYNQSVAGNELDSTLAADARPSQTSDRAALGIISGNNGICLANQAQLDKLQEWIRESEKARAQTVHSK